MKSLWLLVALAAASPAHAAAFLDQSNVVKGTDTTLYDHSPNSPGQIIPIQTFTVGYSGTLSSVALQASVPDPQSLTLSLFRVSKSNGTMKPLATGAYSENSFGFLNFTTNLAVVAGDLLAMSPRYEGSGFRWAVGGNSYANGFFGGAPASGAYFVPLDAQDAGFVTYIKEVVIPPPPGPTPGVPEPATWFMLVSGFAAVGYALRRRTAGLIPAA